MIHEEEEVKDNLFEVVQHDNQDNQMIEMHSGEKLKQGIITTTRNLSEEDNTVYNQDDSPSNPGVI